ncbi:fatty acid desaturase family protein [Taibaiella soli]|uniref:Acyl-CoA desaturase n=1 Tax=Taibaiella soli TaxID=1649169 RepID=A0A2W2C0V7_9BACT|nr:fatty acid desaturase [Taibaiella soli]PZF73643.1 acyl-CoA desaturase [Taibaiella soli]
MALFDHILEPPSYGWKDAEGNLVKPSNSAIFKEFRSRLNIFRDRKNWMTFTSWIQLACLLPFLLAFLVFHFSIGLFAVGFVYSMILMGTHGTIWYHRYCTHGAYTFKNNFWRFVTQHLVIKTVFEEIYTVSHHVHHAKSDEPGDPYNANAGFLYCFLADANHQPINRNLSAEEYQRVVHLMKHTGVTANSYEAYKKWGSIDSPGRVLLSWFLNWTFWGVIFYAIGQYALDGKGIALLCTMFGSAFVWTLGVRTFNFEGHGKGKDKRVDGVDYNRKDMSINQIWPGYVAGEWHNNHHLYPASARSGFLPYQLDLAYCYIKMLHIIGGVDSYRDSKKQFLEQYRNPYTAQKKAINADVKELVEQD